MQRKIIHAFFAGPSPGDLDRTTGVIYAVCNDGSFWRSVPGKFTTWEREANIPDGYDNFEVEEAKTEYRAGLPEFSEKVPAAHGSARTPDKKVSRGKSHHA